MSQSTQPIFGGPPLLTIVNVSVADATFVTKANPVDSSSFRLIMTAGNDGGFIDTIDYQAIGTGTPATNVMNIWVTDNLGANAQITQQISVAGGTLMSTTNKGVYLSTAFNFMNLGAGQKVFVSFMATIPANVTYNVTANTGSFTAAHE